MRGQVRGQEGRLEEGSEDMRPRNTAPEVSLAPLGEQVGQQVVEAFRLVDALGLAGLRVPGLEVEWWSGGDVLERRWRVVEVARSGWSGGTGPTRNSGTASLCPPES